MPKSRGSSRGIAKKAKKSQKASAVQSAAAVDPAFQVTPGAPVPSVGESTPLNSNFGSDAHSNFGEDANTNSGVSLHIQAKQAI
ncbi:protein of unknown function, partial [Taphrina deformans PYCC 5710]